MAEQTDAHLVGMTIRAVAEVRDADGNLIDSTPVEFTTTITAEQAAALQGDTP